jgi:hypothetical protein
MSIGNRKHFCCLCDCFVIEKCDHSAAFSQPELDEKILPAKGYSIEAITGAELDKQAWGSWFRMGGMV